MAETLEKMTHFQMQKHRCTTPLEKSASILKVVHLDMKNISSTLRTLRRCLQTCFFVVMSATTRFFYRVMSFLGIFYVVETVRDD
jgi:hypothetical protein